MPGDCPYFNQQRRSHCGFVKNVKIFVDSADLIVREQTKSEKDEINAKLETFRTSTASTSGEKRVRRKGVN